MRPKLPDLRAQIDALAVSGPLRIEHPWRAAAAEAADAYGAWCEAPLAARDDAYATYRAAEEREAAAAEDLRMAAET